MRALLGRWGCVVATANGLAEAREALAGFGAPDLVIADFHLDNGDGIAAIRALRKELGRPIPAILATADRSPEARDEAARQDIVILHKPVKPAPLQSPARPDERAARGGGVGGDVVMDTLRPQGIEVRGQSLIVNRIQLALSEFSFTPAPFKPLTFRALLQIIAAI